MKTYLWWCLAVWCLLQYFPTQAQTASSTDVAAYQLGLVAEVQPGADLNYTITVTNYGPAEVSSFYIFDGWTISDEGVSGFAEPLGNPDFGEYRVLGAWRQNEEDQIILAWLLEGKLAPGDTLQFDWQVRVDQAYRGVLVNWVSILTEGAPEGNWRAASATALAAPPLVNTAADSNLENNRTTDGITIVTTEPTGQGTDLAIYQTGILTETLVTAPLESTWLVANLGPQPIQQFYVLAGWSLAADGGSLLALPVQEPNFGDFKVLGSWRQGQPDEERWLWLLEGALPPGNSVAFEWSRNINPAYQGDLLNRVEVAVTTPPEGDWLPRLDTAFAPPLLNNAADTFAENDRSDEALTFIRP